jgi:hypothetical protein
MQFAQRYPEIMARFDRFWSGADTDRPLLCITAPKDEPDLSVPPPQVARPEDRVLPEAMVAAARHRLATTAYAAEGYPHCFVNFGPGALHGCIGGDLDLSHADTVWFPPFLSDVEEFPSLRFQPEGKWWTAILRATSALLEEVGEEMVVSLTDIGGGGDVVASAVGRQLLVDIAERPQAVRAAVDHCHTLWLQAYESDYELIHRTQDVSSTWWPIVSRGRTYMTQCDINALISPRAFRELFLDDLAGIYAQLDRGAYHLDGIGTEAHMPALVATPGLHCIQWVPAPGTSALRHAEMLREIQKAGVNVTFNLAPEEVEQACRLLDPRRLFLNVWCRSEREAGELVENALRWSEGR